MLDANTAMQRWKNQSAMMNRPEHLLILDFETFYSKEYSLKCMSVPEYVLDPRFEVLLLAAFDMTWKAPRIIAAGDIVPFLQSYDPATTLAVAHNMLFDGAVLNYRYRWLPACILDTLGMARALRRYDKYDLGSLARELLGHNSKGDILYKTIGLDRQGIKAVGLHDEFRAYAMNDVRLCAHIFAKLFPEFPEEERQVMNLVLRAALDPKLRVNVGMLQEHLDELRERKRWLLNDCGYDKASLMSTQLFRKALEQLDVEIEVKISPTGRSVPAFARTDQFMTDLVGYDKSEDEETNFKVQTLAAARLAHKSTIEETRAKKFLTIGMLPWWEPNLLPMPLRYGGAHTHRLSGDWGMNVQNLPRGKSKLRSALVAPPGHKVVAADLSQIECRIVAQLAGEHVLIEQFRAGDDVYAKFGERVFHRSINKKDDPEARFISKTAVLGLGYGCGWSRFHKMVTTSARQYAIPIEGLFNESKAQYTVSTYRSMFARIPALWARLDRLLDDVIFAGVDTQKIDVGPVTLMRRRIRLPNDLFLRYEKVERKKLWGGALLENISQALARVIIMQAAVRLASIGYSFVLQAHDELVFCIPDDQVDEAKQAIMREMIRPPGWMPDIPLDVEIGVGSDYGECK